MKDDLFTNMPESLVTMKGDLFTNMLGDIRREILSRLPIRSIITCKYVCKSWRNLIEGGQPDTRKLCLVFEYKHLGYTVGDEAFKSLAGYWSPTSHIKLSAVHHHCTTRRIVIDSANGFFLTWHACHNIFVICNPVIDEYFMLPCPPTRLPRRRRKCAFVVRVMRRRYKILYGVEKSCVHVHTSGLGFSLWTDKRVEVSESETYVAASILNGNILWVVKGNNRLMYCFCFDLETEVITKVFPLF